MKIDSHVLFLIIVIGVISAGIVGATVMNTDTSMKKEVFDGITVAVPADSEFVKVDDGVYKDANYGIKINTFKNNDSMIDFLKNTKKSKIIPIEDQPPQSVAFKKGDNINILVTNGNEGISIGSKDGKLTSQIANNVVFSNNHKSVKPAGLPFVKQPMKVENDYNLIMLLVADVDTKIFNVDMLQNNLVVVVDDYNEELDQPADDVGLVDNDDADEDLGEVSDISNQEDLNNALSDANNTTASDDKTQETQSNEDTGSNNGDTSQATVVSDNPQTSDSGNAAGGSSMDNNPSADTQSSSNSDSGAGSDTSSSSSNTQQQPQKMSEGDCEQLAEQAIMSNPDLQIESGQSSGDSYVFSVVDTKNNNAPVGTITVDAISGNVDVDSGVRSVL